MAYPQKQCPSFVNSHDDPSSGDSCEDQEALIHQSGLHYQHFSCARDFPHQENLSFVDQLKSSWIMEDISLHSKIIQKLDNMHHNMVADGSWNNTNEKDSKTAALASMVNDMKTKYGMLTLRRYRSRANHLTTSTYKSFLAHKLLSSASSLRNGTAAPTASC